MFLLVATAASLRAQTAPQVPEPPLRRWLDIQTFSLYSRYRFIENSADVTTSNQGQYKDAFRARFNLDPAKRYTVNVGYFSGNSFTSTWDNIGIGNNTAFDRKDNYFKQLYASAVPVKGLELQYGGLYMSRGESDEWVSYDDDGYVVGERVTVRRPKLLYLDELTVTRGAIGPLATPNLASRWGLLKTPNYTQVLGSKRFSHVVTGSLEYDRQVGADILRAAVTLHLDKGAPVSTVRYEQYRRLSPQTASGYGVWAERAVTKYARIQGGYVTVDQFYGGWNADRMQNGRRVFAYVTVPIHGPLAASFYATQALSAPYAVSINRRIDVVISYDVLASLRKTGVF